MKIVLQKFIADSGLCSRRKAEQLIKDKKVSVNGQEAELGMKVSGEDKVEVEKKIIKINNKKIYLKLNKPAGYTCTNKKFKGERNIFELINLEERLFAIGRLDKNSRGLVLLTNDGKLTQELTHPGNEHEKEYITQVRQVASCKPACPVGRLQACLSGRQACLSGRQVTSNNRREISDKLRTIDILREFKRGIDIGEGDGIASAKKIEYLGDDKFKIILTQGKKRQIRRMFGKLGYEVMDLVRIRIDDIKLGSLEEGKWERISV